MCALQFLCEKKKIENKDPNDFRLGPKDLANPDSNADNKENRR